MKKENIAPECMSIYPNIEAERARMQLTVDALMDKIGVKTRKSYYQWLRRGHIPEKRLVKMAETFGCSVEYLLGETDNRYSEIKEGA